MRQRGRGRRRRRPGLRSPAAVGLLLLVLLGSSAAASQDSGTSASMGRGLAAFEHSEWARAIEAFERAVEDPAAPVDAWMYLGLARWHSGDREGAAAALATATELGPERGRVWLLLGLVRLEQGRLDVATEALCRARQLRPDDAVAHLAVGRLQTSQMQLEAAEESLTRALQLDPRNPAVRAAIGVLRVRQGDLHEARAELDRVLRLAPDDRQSRFLAAAVALRLDEPGEAERQARELLRRDPLSARAHQLLAAALEARGEAAAAAAERETYRALAESEQIDGTAAQLAGADGRGRQVVSPSSLLQEAEAARRDGFHDRAAELARMAMSMDSGAAVGARHTLALIHRDRGDNEKAADLLAGLWRDGVRDLAVAHDLALAYIGDGWPELAVEVLMEVTGVGAGAAETAAPGHDDPGLHQVLAVAAVRSGQERVAVLAAERAVELAPGRAVLYRILAEAYELAGDTEGAERARHRYEELSRLER